MGGTGTLTEEVGALPDTTIQELWMAAVGGTKKSYSDFLSPLRGVWKVQGVPQVRRVPSSILLYIHPPRYHGFLYQFRHKSYEDMKYDHDMKIGRITHKDNQDTSTTRRLKSTEILLSPPRPVSTSTRPKTNQPQCDRRVARKPYQTATTASTSLKFAWKHDAVR